MRESHGRIQGRAGVDLRKRPEHYDWYGSARWKAIREYHLANNQLCVMCLPAVTIATVCDHIEPHRGDPVKFWAGPFQSLCAHHHNSTKQSAEKGGKAKPTYGEDGWPI